MRLALKALGIGPETVVINRSEAPRAKPDLKCRRGLGVVPQEAYAVGDAFWDLTVARRVGMLPTASLRGGCSQDELSTARPY